MGCRERAYRSDLLRVVAVGDQLMADPSRRAPGRGAHLHLDLACLDRAERRKAFSRALRLPRAPHVDAVRHYVQTANGPTRPESDEDPT
ncbi:MAG: YlxR family protein [Mycobacteriales bacterium]